MMRSRVVAGAVLFGSAAFGQAVDVGHVVTHLEAVTGAWEMLRPDGSVVGLSIQINTELSGTAVSLTRVEQRAHLIRIETYLRKGSELKQTFWLSSAAAGLQWSGDHLVLHSRANPNGISAVDLDLVFDAAKGEWHGALKNAYSAGNVVLRRPSGVDATAPLGTWIVTSRSVDQRSCVHLAMGADGRLVGWSDLLTFGGLTRYPQGMKPPEYSQNAYGERDIVSVEEHLGSHWTFQLGNVLSGNTFTGDLSEDGSTFSGTSNHFGNGVTPSPGSKFALPPFTWKRVAGGSCAGS